MTRAGLLVCLLLAGCFEDPALSGFLDRDAQPGIILRCEEGRIAAYVTLGPPAEADSGGGIPDGAVPVQLDSTQPC